MVMTPDELYIEWGHLITRFEAAVMLMEAEARYIGRPVWRATLCEALKEAIEEVHSPWLNPNAAATYSRSSFGFVYLMAKEGVIKRYGGDNSPRFLKSEIDAAIREGRWQSSKKKKRRS